MATQKQKQVVKKIIENHGNISKSMREVGYAHTTASSSKRNLTESKGFKELMEQEGLTDKFLLGKHKALLEKKETLLRNNIKTGKIDRIKTKEIDVQAVKSGLDMAYKLKGDYAPEKREHKFQDNLTEEELNAKIDKLLAETRFREAPRTKEISTNQSEETSK